MKIVVLISLLIVLLFPNPIRIVITLVASVIWFIYALIYSYKLYNLKDKKVITDKYLEEPPNNNYSPYIRYLYSGKVDYKVFFLVVLELILKGSISIKEENNIYYLIDNKIKDEVLNKSEINVKKILFKDIGEGHYLVINNMIDKCNKNSGYIYSVYKEWESVFEYEAAFNKYFKSNKSLVDKSTTFLVISFILSLYNIFFTKKIIIALFIFIAATIICKYINDLKNRELDAKTEYEKWIKFKNYINKYDNTLYKLDDFSLQQYLLYAYSLDSYFAFKKVIDKKENIKEENILLLMVKRGYFNSVEYIFDKSIDKLKINTLFLFAQNKGRR